MEKKERYVIRYDLDYNQCLIDTEENQGVGDYIKIVKLLNQQSKRIKEFEQEIQQLKQQLAEKDKEISNLNGLVRERDKQIKNLKTNKKRVIEHKNKTKISFAVEQLEKLKVELHIIHTNGYLKAIDEEIDNQINGLKGEKK